MATFIATHEVDDVDRWLESPVLGKLLEPLEGASFRKFRDPAGSTTTGVLFEIPDHLVPTLMERLQSQQSHEG